MNPLFFHEFRLNTPLLCEFTINPLLVYSLCFDYLLWEIAFKDRPVIVALKWGRFLSKVWNRKHPPLLASKNSYRLRFYWIFGEALLYAWLNSLWPWFQKVQPRVFKSAHKVHDNIKIMHWFLLGESYIPEMREGFFNAQNL